MPRMTWSIIIEAHHGHMVMKILYRRQGVYDCAAIADSLAQVMCKGYASMQATNPFTVLTLKQYFSKCLFPTSKLHFENLTNVMQNLGIKQKQKNDSNCE